MTVSADYRRSPEPTPAKGGPDLRCAISVNLRGRRRIHVSDVAETSRQALEGAVAQLG